MQRGKGKRDNNKVPTLKKLAASQVSHGLFPRNDDVVIQNLAPVLLQHVIDANWSAVTDMLKKEPLLMFERVASEDVNDPRLPDGTKLSPLEYACFVRDRYTRDICKSVLTPKMQEQYNKTVQSFPISEEIPSHEATIAEDGYIAFKTMVERWLTNDAENPVSIEDLRTYLLEQTHQFTQREQIYCLQPFFWACEAFVSLADRRENHHDPLVTDAKLKEFWQKIDGFAKRYLLPSHMLKQMQAKCERECWQEDAQFNETNYPAEINVEDLRDQQLIRALRAQGKTSDIRIDTNSDANPDDIFGEDYSLIRGTIWGQCSILECGDDLFTCEDLAIFRHLDSVRRSEFIREQLGSKLRL